MAPTPFMAQLTMTEILHKKPLYDTEREDLQNRLAAIDRDADKLQDFIGELYGSYPDNPHILYAAATHLTALTYLDRRDTQWQPLLPDPEQANEAFLTYTRLLAMLDDEKKSPLYAGNERVQLRLVGAREELAFHATLTYATTQGADFVVLPTPAELDFNGAEEASDVLVFFPQTGQTPLEIQVTSSLGTKKGRTYRPHIPVVSLSSALGGSKKAGELRGLLKTIGDQGADSSSTPSLTEREHNIVMSGSAAILTAANTWVRRP